MASNETVTVLSHVEKQLRSSKMASGSAIRRPIQWNAGRLAMTALAAGLLLSGCGKKQGNASAASNTAASPNSSSAPAESSARAESSAPAQPAQNRSAQAPARSSKAPAQAAKAAPAPIPPKMYTIPAGTHLEIRMGQTLSARDNNIGDGFQGRLVRAVHVGGVTVLPAGTPVSGAVVAAKGQGRFKGTGDLGITLNRVGDQAVATTVYERVAKGKGKRSAEFIGGGAGLGALIGGLTGGGKGAAIGGLVGGGAGTAGAAYTGNKNVVIPAESIVSFSLTRALTIAAVSASTSR